MSVFVLCTGRSGLNTISRACMHVKNFTYGHENGHSMLFDKSMNCSNNHIEVDNRLNWFLGQLNQKYVDKPIYVHLQGNELKTPKSWFQLFAESILMPHQKGGDNSTTWNNKGHRARWVKQSKFKRFPAKLVRILKQIPRLTQNA